jgi:translation initiation factor IF-1
MKEETIKIDGQVVDVLPNAMFRVQIPGQTNLITGVISGRMRQFNIKILLGDTVELELSPYDLTRGRITRRR